MRETIFQRLSKRKREHAGAAAGIGVLIKIERAAGRARQAVALT
jgi:hypothetical protein